MIHIDITQLLQGRVSMEVKLMKKPEPPLKCANNHTQGGRSQQRTVHLELEIKSLSVQTTKTNNIAKEK
jgi:hypothetical protein